MPTYEYECKKCSHRFEVFQKMTDKPLVECPKCEGRLKRLIGSGSGIIFKGSGFYATDYKKQGSSGAGASQEKPKTCPKIKEGCDGCKANG
ncbi:MAG: zinc ribbon domain-containing protein [Candidatus Omnitrophica bacterium]|nr:zinc ribbon domain-containing protein [Candidatus Omnitrophota bacterium]